MSDEKDPPTLREELEPPGRPLESLRDVRRALAFVLRRIESGSLDHKTGHTLVIGLNCLGGLLQDARDSKWTKRAAVLWSERKGADSEATN